jgi:HSP20 family protein
MEVWLMVTSLMRRRPFADFDDFHTRLDRLFEDVVASGEKRDWTTAIDVIKNEDHLVVRADKPGLEPDDIKIQVEDDILTVSGEHEESREEKDENFVRRERRYGSFTRSIALPTGIHPDKIEATCKDGVLEVTVPLPEQAKKKAVEIKPKAPEK